MRRSISIRCPGGVRFHAGFERHGALWLPGGIAYGTNLLAVHRDPRGRLIKEYDLGSGLVTNIGVDLMANDFTIAGAPTLKEMNFHGCGTGTTAAAAADYYLQTATAAASLTGSTNGYFTGTQSFVSPNIYKTAATFTYAASVAVTEWALLMSNAANFTGTATSTGNNTLTNTGAAFTTTGNALSGWAVEASATAVNTPTTTAWGLVLSNTATVLTIAGPSASSAWLTLANASAAVPSGTTAYVVYPGMWDHKQFAAINVNSGDTIAFTYQLTINSGG